jgi:hypothetical protein
MDFDVATVRVRVDGHRWLGRSWAFEQRARAAPSDYVLPVRSPGGLATFDRAAVDE